MAEPVPGDAPADRIPGYRVLAPLGAGGMGVVYRALHEGLGREVALKVMGAGAGADRQALARFLREIKLAASIRHPHMVLVFDGGLTPDRVPYLSMELVEGRTLQAVAAEAGPMAWPVALALVASLAAGLEALHAAGILHRDIKPENVMIPRAGGLKLLDFGLARALDGTQLTDAGHMLGTPLYMAPEVLRGAPASRAADYWALGAVAYRLLTGEPHARLTGARGWADELERPIVPPSVHQADIPEAVDALVLALLARDPGARGADLSPRLERAARLVARIGPGGLEGLLGPHIAVTPATVNARAIQIPGLAAGWRARASSEETPASPALVRSRGASGTTARVRDSARTTAPARSIRRTLAGVCAACTFLLAAWLAWTATSHPRAQPTPAPPKTSVASAAAAGPHQVPSHLAAAVAIPPATLFEEWRIIESHAAVLARDDAASRKLQKRLQTLIRLPVTAPSTWAYWAVLGRWLADPQRPASPPRASVASVGPVDVIAEQITFGFLNQLRPPDPRMLAGILEVVAGRPDDGRGWLALVAWLDAEGLAAQARAALAIALPRLPGRSLDDAEGLFWQTLARGLYREGRIQAEWLARVRAGNGRWRAWEALRRVLPHDERDLLRRLLESGMADPELRPGAAVELAALLEDGGDVSGARALLRAEVAGSRSNKTLRAALARHLLDRGQLDEVKAMLPTLAADANARPAAELLLAADGSPSFTLPAEHRLHPAMLGLGARLLRRAGRQSEIPALLAPALQQAPAAALDRLRLQLAADGLLVDGLDAAFEREHAQADSNRGAFDALTSLLSAPGMAARFAAAFQRPRPRRECDRLIEAVARSRAGDLGVALDLVSSLPPLAAAARRRAVFEVCARPLWRWHAGLPVDREVVARARQMMLPGDEPLLSVWLTALKGQDRAATVPPAAAAFDRDPDSPVTALGYAYAAVSLPADQRKPIAAQIDRVCLYYGLGAWMERELAALPR